MNDNDIIGTYHIKIFKDGDWFLAEITMPNQQEIWTQGRNAEEIVMMFGDAILTFHSVKLSWWNRLLSRMMIYKYGR